MKGQSGIWRLWRDSPVRAKGLVAVAIPLFALIATTLLIYRTRQHQNEAVVWLRHTIEVRSDLREVREKLVQSEAAFRGYALTGDAKWLADNERTEASLWETINRIRVSFKRNPQQGARLNDLTAAIEEHRAALAATQKIYSSRLTPEVMQASLAKEMQAMEKVNRELRLLLELEDSSIIPVRETYARSERLFVASVAASLGIGGIATVLGMLLFTSGIGNRIKHLRREAENVGNGLSIARRSAANDELGKLEDALVQSSQLIAQQKQSLTEAKVEAEQANKAKSEFLSRMSHELRTPLNSILGFAQVLQMGELNDRSTACVEHILKGGRHLLGLIDEILDIARIEAGRLALSTEPVLIEEALSRALDMVAPIADGGKVKLRCAPAPIADQHVIADSQRLQQILLNLLSNAVKYNRPGGSVQVSWKMKGDSRIQIEVSDTGIGLSEQDQALLFTPFERLSASRTDIQGTGLGLVLSKRLLEAMHGSIGLRSEIGKGTTFWIELAAAEAPVSLLAKNDALLSEVALETGTSQTVLYVEDNISNLKLMEHLLEYRPQVKLLPAMQGTLALQLAIEHRPDLIFLDLHLPDLNGDVILRQLRADPRTRDIPTIIISADATPGQVRRLLDDGADEYLTKPFDVSRLLKILDGNLRSGPEDAKLRRQETQGDRVGTDASA